MSRYKIDFKIKYAKRYLGRFQCPYCGSKKVERVGSLFHESDRFIHVNWHCDQCDDDWSELYKLNAIMDKKDNLFVFREKKL